MEHDAAPLQWRPFRRRHSHAGDHTGGFMKLYNSLGPNPAVVRMFAAEKGIDLPKVEVDIMKADNRKAEHLKRNPAGQMPTLELDNGAFLSEIQAICEYLEGTFA